jgi:acetyl esterase/lipase
MRVFGWSGLAVLFLLALLNFSTLQNLTVWKLSILATEYGHWLGMLCLLLAIAFFRDWKIFIPLLVTAGIYFVPTVQLIRNFPRWESELTGVFGYVSKDPTERLPDFKRLFTPRVLTPKPETYVFDEAHGKLSLDFFRTSRPNAPFVLVLHGGGWNSGERTQFADMSQYFANLGYSMASVDYRLAPNSKWPAPLEDVLKSVEYLKANAVKLGIDPNRWVIFGRSAGGQIAERVAYAHPTPHGLKGCIAFYAPADMNFAYLFGDENDILKSPSLLREYLGGDPKQVRESYDDASPILLVNASSPPTLLIHGPRDPLVWIKQSERLYAKLQMAYVPSVLIRLPWATHGFDFNLDGPGGQVATFSIGRFLGKVFQE